MRRIAIVGASLAGVRAAEALRAQGFDGELTIVGAETHLPYDRPPLSKDFLLGKAYEADLQLLTDDAREALEANWILGRSATGLHSGRVSLDDAADLMVDGIVIATGARARQLPLGLPDAGVHTLRTLDDAIALGQELLTAHRVVIVGAGFIGAEVASTATALGKQVTIVEAAGAPFHNSLGPVGAKVLCDAMLEHGVDVRTGVGIADLLGEDRISRAVLTDGSMLDADLVVVGIGAIPNTEWLESSQVRCDNGILTDAWGRTSMANVVAAGDVARFQRGTGRIRIEHWTAARDMPAVAVRALLADAMGVDHGTEYAAPPYFWSDQFGHRIQVAGRIRPVQPLEVVAGAIQEGRFVAIQRLHDAVTAVLGWNMPREFTRWRRTNTDSLCFTGI